MKKTLILLVLTLLFCGCSKDDTNDSEKMIFESSIRQSLRVKSGDKAIKIVDARPETVAPIAYDSYCPNPEHDRKLEMLDSSNIDSNFYINCGTCGAFFYSNGQPKNDFTKKLNLRLKMYNIKYDESIKSYIIW